jgi:lysophospholipase L1-like esterase
VTVGRHGPAVTTTETAVMRTRATTMLLIVGLVLLAFTGAATADDAAPAVVDIDALCGDVEVADFPDRGGTHARAIDCLTALRDRDGQSVLRGFDDGVFAPDRIVRRDQLAAFLDRFLTVADPTLGDPSAGEAAAGFTDTAGTTHERSIERLAARGILDGRIDGSFGPGEPVSRGAAASALARTLEVAGVGLPDRPTVRFVDQGATHGPALGSLAQLGVVAGVGDGAVEPATTLTRGQLASLLARGAQLLDDDGAFATDPVTGAVAVAIEPLLPRPTPAATHPPHSLAALGDSISLASGATRPGEGVFQVTPGGSEPARSWTTGTADGLGSIRQRLQAVAAGPVVADNLAVNFASMRAAVTQAAAVPVGTELVTIQLGGNDLCRASIGEMTPTSVFAEQARAALEVLADEHPAALVQVSSVPDVYRLWEILRDDDLAVAVWNGTSLLPGLVPCQSLLADARSDAPADEARRVAVRARSRAYNAALAAVCADFVRCRFDDDAVWSFTNDPDSFGVDDISRVDFFHPSFAGQRKLAAVAWNAGFDHARTVAPRVDVEVDDVTVTGAVVRVQADGPAVVAGIEYRHLAAGARRPAWQSTVGPEAVIARLPGVALEIRAVDVDGNTGASTVVDLRF